MEILPKTIFSLEFARLLNILNGNDVAGSPGVETFVYKFNKPLSFSLLYNFVRNHEQFIYNQDIPQGYCLCEVFENSCHLARGSNKSAKTDLPTNSYDIVEENCCNSAKIVFSGNVKSVPHQKSSSKLLTTKAPMIQILTRSLLI